MKMPSRVLLIVCVTCIRLFSQQYEARFRLEKEQWLVGEPIIAVFELKNISNAAIAVNDHDCFHTTWFESDDAPKPASKHINLQGCSAGAGYAGSCLMGSRLLQPRETQTRRYVVKDGFSLGTKGEFHVVAKRRVDLLDSSSGRYTVLSGADTATTLTVKVREGDRAEVLSVYGLLERESKSSDYKRAGFALDALTADPPEYLEDVMISLADDKQRVYSAIRGLSRIGTDATRRKLAQIVDSSEGALQQMALNELAQAADPRSCDFMLRKISELKEWNRSLAIMSAGASCGERAIPYLTTLDSQDFGTRAAVASGLGDSGSRDAVPILIEMLVDPEPFVRGSADRGLFTLTRRKSSKGTSDPSDARAARNEWQSYWALHGKDQTIYKAKDCTSD